jgi:hypothetical protein
MDAFDFAVMVEDSPVETHVVEYRNKAGQLMAACLTDAVRFRLVRVKTVGNERFLQYVRADRSAISHPAESTPPHV